MTTPGGERVELRMRGRLTPRTAGAFAGMSVSEAVETTVLVEVADDDATALLRALVDLHAEILAIRSVGNAGRGRPS